jgi:UDP-N-acetyl-D-mannosaminuronic acid dehydrogenase
MGLPLGIRFAECGAIVTLLDRDVGRVEAVRAGRMPFFDSGADDCLRAVVQNGALRAASDPTIPGGQDAVILTIGTPIDEFFNPEPSVVQEACRSVLDRMDDGQVLILRSTLLPGTTERVAAEAVAGGRRVHVAYCPDRTTEGNALNELHRLPQIVAGTTPAACALAARIFKLLQPSIIELSPLEAELGKLFTNAYRYITFAIANQFFGIARRAGADFERIHRAITRDYPRMQSFPRAGLAAGPCLLKDTAQLAAFDFGTFPLGQAAVIVNEGFPALLIEQTKTHFDLSAMTAGILGMTFKGNTDDARGSLAYKLRKVLRWECREVLCTDCHLADPEFVPLDRVLKEADILFIGACHDAYRGLTFRQPVIDCFGFLNRQAEAKPELRIHAA